MWVFDNQKQGGDKDGIQKRLRFRWNDEDMSLG